MIKAIGFDLQFTIVHLPGFTLGRWFNLFDAGFERVTTYLEELGFKIDSKRLRMTLKRKRNKYFAITISEEQAYFTEEILGDTFAKMQIELSASEFENCIQLYHSIEISAWKLYPNVQETLRQLTKDYKLALLTNAPKYVARKILKTNGIDAYFTYLFADIRKPRLSGFRQFQAALSADFSELCMVGDDIRADIEPAIQLGMKTVHAFRGYEYLQHHAEVDITPDKKVDHFEDVFFAVKELDST